jgi:SEFIR domain
MRDVDTTMEPHHRDALLHFYEAERAWAQEGQQARSFLLLHTGGMQSHIDHPRWDESWPVPSEHMIDDLAEMRMLRVDPSPNEQRAFVLTIAGREYAAKLLPNTVAALTPETRTVTELLRTSPNASVNPTALVSWAHDTPAWQRTMVEFAVLLRQSGVDADIDLFELHNPNINWSTWGTDAIERNEFVLLAVSANYRKRWEDHGDPTEGAGAAREANVLKTLFDRDRNAFYYKVKIVILPGATIQDVPAELGAAAQRFELREISASSLEDLLRTLTRQPAFPRPQLGPVPVLPASFLGHGNEPQPQTTDDTINRLQARLQELAAARDSIPYREEPEQNDFREEETTLYAALRALTPAAIVGAEAHQLGEEQATMDTTVPDWDERRMLTAIYAVFIVTAQWPKFQHISLTLSSTADPREIYYRLSAKGLVRPRINPRHGFQLREETDVGISLRGLTYVPEATEDLSNFTNAARYIAERAVTFRAPSPTEIGRLTMTSEELRLALGLGDRLVLSRVGRLIADELPVWSSFGDPATSEWQFEVVPERARRYRDVHTVIEVLACRNGDAKN